MKRSHRPDKQEPFPFPHDPSPSASSGRDFRFGPLHFDRDEGRGLWFLAARGEEPTCFDAELEEVEGQVGDEHVWCEGFRMLVLLGWLVLGMGMWMGRRRGCGRGGGVEEWFGLILVL